MQLISPQTDRCVAQLRTVERAVVVFRYSFALGFSFIASYRERKLHDVKALSRIEYPSGSKENILSNVEPVLLNSSSRSDRSTSSPLKGRFNFLQSPLELLQVLFFSVLLATVRAREERISSTWNGTMIEKEVVKT